MAHIRGVILDVDGTLIDSNDAQAKAWVEAMAEYGYSVPYDIEAAQKIGIGTIALRCGGWEDADLAGAIAIYDDPADLLAHYDSSPLAE